ncbi:acidic mammalian chitinase-like isoform X2 [Vanacampus margaritifer]
MRTSLHRSPTSTEKLSLFDVLWSLIKSFPQKIKSIKMHKLILFTGLCLTTAWLGSAEKLVCLYDSVSDQRQGIGHFEIDDIQAHLCTHLIYSFVGIDKTFKISPSSSDEKKFPLFKKLKNRPHHVHAKESEHVWSNSNTHLKTILEVNVISDPLFHELIAIQANRATFIQSVISILREPNYMFDGINILWQNKMDDFQKYREYFTFLIEEFRKEFNKEAVDSECDALLLTVSVSADPTVITQSYDVKEIADDIDFFNVMTSDIEIVFLKGRPSYCPPEESFRKAASAVNFWNKAGVPTHKINMGIGVFGEAYYTDSQGSIELAGGLLADLPEGFLARFEVCIFLQELLKASSTTRVVFDDIASIDVKVDYIKKHHFGGAFVLSLDLDDFNHICCSHDHKYPVIQHLHDKLVLDFVIH